MLALQALTKDKFDVAGVEESHWDALDRLHSKGYISDPHGQAKSVVVTEGCERLARELIAQRFGTQWGEPSWRRLSGVTHRYQRGNNLPLMLSSFSSQAAEMICKESSRQALHRDRVPQAHADVAGM